MKEERKPENIWNAERILYAYIYNSDNDGCLPNVDSLHNSLYKIGHQRFYAALRAYGREPEWFYRSDVEWGCRDKCRYLLSKTRSNEKMKEFRDLVKKHLRHTPSYDFRVQNVDSPDFLKSEMEVSIVFRKLMEYRKKLHAVEEVWSRMMECGKSVGVIYQVTRDMTREHIWPMCQILDRMIVLLMGDDYDKTYTEEELFQYGYPDVTDEELNRMEMAEEW